MPSDDWEAMRHESLLSACEELRLTISATIGINFAIGGPIGIINFLGVFPGIRKQDWYHSLAGWGSWFMPAASAFRTSKPELR